MLTRIHILYTHTQTHTEVLKHQLSFDAEVKAEIRLSQRSQFESSHFIYDEDWRSDFDNVAPNMNNT